MKSCTGDAVTREEMKRFLYADFIDVVTSVIDRAEQRVGVHLEKEFKVYVVRFYTEAMAGMLIDWAQNGKPQEKEQTVQNLAVVIGTAIESMLLEMGRHK